MDLDWELRLAALDQVSRLSKAGDGLVDARDLKTGFIFRGERVPLFNQAVGIWRPRLLEGSGAALSLTTAPPKSGKQPPYTDSIGSDAAWLAYKYQRWGAEHWMNQAVVRALELQRPLVYFFGTSAHTYQAIFPVYVVEADDPTQTFHLAADASAGLAIGQRDNTAVLEARRAYATRMVKVRLHQRQFRELVMQAYRTTCSVCRIRHNPLLDAAHILEDRDQRGRPEVPNGLSLCKIHHAAFDANILGVSPDCIVHIRQDILDEIDGPMLQHGIKEMMGVELAVPRNTALRPHQDYLAERFDRFRAA